MQKEKYMKEILDKYSDMVYRIALTRCRNKENAEDVFQDVFVKFSEKLPKFESKEHEKAWFIRVTLNLTKNLLTANWNTKVVGLDEDIMVENEETSDIYSAVMALPDNYRMVIYLLYYEGYKVKEIANILSINENTIKTWLMRAREILKKNIEGGLEDE